MGKKLNKENRRQVNSNNDNNKINVFKFTKNDTIGVKVLNKEQNYNKDAYLVEKFKIDVVDDEATFTDTSNGKFYLPQHKNLMEQIFDTDIGKRLIIRCNKVPTQNSNGQYSKAEYEVFSYDGD